MANYVCYVMPLLFATVVIHAYHMKSTAYHHIFTLATVLSVFQSYTILKKLVGYFIFFWVVEMHAPRGDKWWLLLFPTFLTFLWSLHYLFPSRTHSLPAAVGLVSVVGMHFYIQQL
jgi:hypothetical protein